MDLGRGKMSGYRYEVFLLSSSPLLRLYHFISKTLRTVKWDDFRILLPVSWPIHSFTSLKIQCWQHHSLIFLTLDKTEMRSNWLRARFPRRNRETGRCENFNCARRFCISKFFSLALATYDTRLESSRSWFESIPSRIRFRIWSVALFDGLPVIYLSLQWSSRKTLLSVKVWLLHFT